MKIGTAVSNAATARGNAETASNTLNGELTPLNTDYTTKLGNENT
jgi:hypothetical protein